MHPITLSVCLDGLDESGVVLEKTVTLDPEGETRVVLSLKRFILPECHTLGIKNEVHYNVTHTVNYSIPREM